MTTYTERDLAEVLQMYADYIQREMDRFDRVSDLPTGLINSRAEIRARKIARDILEPVRQRFASAAENAGMEAERSKNHYEGVEQYEIDF